MVSLKTQRKTGVVTVWVTLALGAGVVGHKLLTKDGKGRGLDSPGPSVEGGVVVGSRSWEALRPARGSHDAAMGEGPSGTAGPFLVAGVVVDSQGHPKVGAKVQLDGDAGTTSETDGDGAFVFPSVPSGLHRLEVVGPLGRSLPWVGDVRQPKVDLKLRMDERASLEVLVVDSRGVPLADARVTPVGAEGAERTTDAAGMARWESVKAGDTTVTVVRRGYSSLVRSIGTIPEGGSAHKVRLVLSEATVVDGVVLDEQGRPLEGARIVAMDAAGLADVPVPCETTSDGQGRWRLPCLGAGTYRFRAEMEGLRGEDSPAIRIESNQKVAGLTLKVGSGGSVFGQVYREGRVEEGGAQVRAWLELGTGPELVASAVTDAKGNFQFPRLPRGPLRIGVTTGPCVGDTVGVDLRKRGVARGVLLVCGDSRTLVGTVETTDGKPVAFAEVLAISSPNGEVRAAVADGRGHFELKGLVQEPHTVMAGFPGESEGLIRSVNPTGTVVDGSGPVRIVLSPRGTLSGRVVAEGETSLGSFHVTLDGGPPTSVIASDGAFHLANVGAGTHELVVFGDGFVPVTLSNLTLAPGEGRDLGVVRVSAGHRLKGRVVAFDGTPVPSARVMVGRAFLGDGTTHLVAEGLSRAALRETYTDEQGQFTMGGVGNEGGLIAAEAPGRGRSAPMRVGPSTEPLVLMLESGGEVRGVVTVGGAPLAHALVTVARNAAGEPPGSSLLGALTGSDGSFRVTDVPRGHWKLIVQKGKEGAGGTRVVDVHVEGATKSSDVKVDFPAMSDVRVTLVLEGQLFSEGVAALMGPETLTAKLRGGRASFSAVSPGTYRVCVLTSEGSLPQGGDPSSRCHAFSVSSEPKSQEVRWRVPLPEGAGRN